MYETSIKTRPMTVNGCKNVRNDRIDSMEHKINKINYQKNQMKTEINDLIHSHFEQTNQRITNIETTLSELQSLLPQKPDQQQGN